MSERDDPGPGQLPPELDPRGPALPPHLDPRGGRPSATVPRVARGPVPPPPLHRPRGRRVARLLSWVALTLSIVLFGLAGVGYAMFRQYDGNINRIPGLSTALPDLVKPAAAPKDAQNILLVGSDTRDTSDGEFQGTGANAVVGQRSDTIILAHLYGDSDQAQLVSFPRDSWVSIPDYTDPKTKKHYAKHNAKINSAITEGGPALLIATIEQLTDIRVDNYVQIDFAGFQSMVQTLGGVEVCLTHNAKDSYSGIDLKAGKQVISGAQALAFVRQRHGLPNGDIDRIKRQQAFIASITRKVLSSGTLLNPFKLNNFLNAATKSVSVDDSLSASGLTKLALRLKSFSAGGVAFSTVPFTDIAGVRDGQSVVLLDATKMETLFAAIRQDRSPQAAVSPTPTVTTPPVDPLTVAPRSIRVSVLNGSGTAGLGRTAATALAAGGFVVVGSPGNRGTGATGTVVRYGPTRADSARTLAAAVPGATLEPVASLGSTLELVVGSSYSGVVPVTVGTPTPAASASPGATAPPVTAANDGCVA